MNGLVYKMNPKIMKVCNVNIVQSTLIISSYMFKSVF